MMIRELIWPKDRVEHLATHSVQPHEVEEVCFGQPLVLRGRTEGENVVIEFPDGKGYPVTARPMTENERRRFDKAKRR